MALVWLAPPAPAEELVLKDGQKIVGSIVGYEDGMFRVETGYGFALVRKDKVASVNFGAGSPGEAVKKAAEQKTRTEANKLASEGARPVKGAASSPGKPVAPVPPSSQSTGAETAAAPRPQAPTAPPPPPVSRPISEPLPPHLDERVEGTSYVNETFRFSMFKPPGWKVFEGIPRETVPAIVALGTEDEQTLLFVHRQAWSGPPDLKKDATEERLQQTYQDYQKISESLVQLDGRPAFRRVFKGVLDGVEWYGVSVLISKDNSVFGIMGLTSAETYQFQQAVFNKIINSFRFLPPIAQSTPVSPAVVTP